MIGQIRGTVAAISTGTVLIDVGGVGYELHCSDACLANLEEGAQASLVVFTEVREDLIRLHGFVDNLEKQVFLMLTKVNGVGARTASDVLSQIDRRELLRAIGAGDVTRLQSLRGIGKKTAERLVVELRDSVGSLAGAAGAPLASRVEREFSAPVDDAVQALVALGFSRRDAERAVSQVNLSTSLDSGAIVKEALKFV